MKSTGLRHKFNQGDIGRFVHNMNGWIIDVTPEYYTLKSKTSGGIYKYQNTTPQLIFAPDQPHFEYNAAPNIMYPGMLIKPQQENKMELRTKAQIEIKLVNSSTWSIVTYENPNYPVTVTLSDAEIFAAAKFVKDTRKKGAADKRKLTAIEKRETVKRLRRAVAAANKDTKEFKAKLKVLGAR